MLLSSKDWSGIGTIIQSPRFEKLRDVQKLQEISEFLQLITKKEQLNSSDVNRLHDKWYERKLNSIFDPQSIWDDISANR